ncbi:MAG: Omp28 family outer membrane lipoprotein [Duncaniella sp.]|nr:Omp28 family outer membrane lipoprotein [Duncaniella sp.]
MKLNNLRYLLAFLPAAMALQSCDDVDTSDRFIETAPVDVARTVLLEDFTGQNCINCPAAHETVHALVEQYGDNIIPVAVHSGGLAISVDRTNFEYNFVGLMTEDGNTYDKRFNTFQTWPAGTVNRGATLSHSDWAAAVRTAITEEADLSIDLSAKTANGKVEIETTLRPSANLSGSLQLWITEDGITARQKLLNGTTDSEYVHNHVFRAAVNGTWGEAMTLTSGVHTSASHSIEIRNTDKERWNANNLTVVAFFYNETGVLQAAKAKVTATIEE